MALPSMSFEPRERQILMNVPATWTAAQKETSFEEQRAKDYAHAFRTTGKPPPPSPDLPANDVARRALGLPVHFQPYIDNPSAAPPYVPPLRTPVSSLAARSPAPLVERPVPKLPIKHPSALPPVQIFHTSPGEAVGGMRDVMISISCQREFSLFSPEELRYYATKSKAPVPPTIFVYEVANDGDLLQSMSCAPHFAAHCLEEHRMAYLLAKRDLSSDEIDKLLYRRPKHPVPVR